MRKFILATMLVAMGMSTMAQECGFDGIHQKMMAEDPAYAARIKANNDYIREYIATHPVSAARGGSTKALYTIPVVVHVIHTGGSVGSIYNPSDAQIIGAIQYLNNIYNGTDASLYGGVGDMEIQFALAQRDPNCNPTTGIVRVDGSVLPNYAANGVNRSGSSGVSDLSLKNLSRWDAANYYNVWVVNKIDGLDGTSGSFVAGYAYFPGASSSLDGTVMLATQMKTGAKTLPHEVGHALNLYHTFQGSSTTVCAGNSNCAAEGDLVCDTDPVLSHNDFSCRTGTNPCTGSAYGINTEYNFMGYTNCYSLFTAGQKARAMAAMTLSSRASLAASMGATPTYTGTPTCPPKINFENSGVTISEGTAGTVDCRKYTDYTVNMTVAADPTAAATATLQLSGTATNMYDYQVTTNGSFTSPSLQVSFPAGAHANKSFTVRVFDNPIVDGPRTIILDFTVNNGGGTALKGSGNITYTINLADNDYAPQSFSSVSAAIGTNSAGGFYQPFRSQYAKARTQALYTASELTAQGFGAGMKIVSIAFNVSTKGSSAVFNGLNIGMKNTTATVLSTGGFETGVTNVYSGNYSTVSGTNTISLATPFVWDGTSNLLVEFCYNNSSASAGNDVIGGTTTSTSMCIWNRDNVGTGCALAPAYNSVSSFVKPDLTFNAQIGSPVASVLNTTQSEYFGPYADIYFINSTNNIIGRIKNLTSFDYGCTTFKIDRAGNNSANFWNTTAGNNLTDKTFLITPTNTTAGGQYEVTLYYTAAEKTGYETSTSKTWNNVSMVKSPLAISGTNSSTTTASTVIVQPTVTRASFGSDYTVMGSFSGSLGGFAAGDPVPVFPLRWLSFTGKITRDLDAELSWITSNEVNTSHFEIEESSNGPSFRKIGTVQSLAATGSGSFNYSFVHTSPAQGNHYYRIRQVDKDGRSTYSITILLYVDGAQEVFVYPVPASDKFVMKFARALQNPVIEILSADMKLVRRETATGNLYEKEMKVSDLAAGVYVLRIVTNGKPQVIRFIKQ